MDFDLSLFEYIAESMAEAIRKEEIRQGHYATGSLDRSIEVTPVITGDILSFRITANDYILELERGSPPGTSGNVDYLKLVDWVKLRGYARGEKEARKVASILMQKWKKTGKPTADAGEYSDYGQRTGAVELALGDWKEKYGPLIKEWTSKQFTTYLQTKTKVVII
jgi:hypothetical protein